MLGEEAEVHILMPQLRVEELVVLVVVEQVVQALHLELLLLDL
jgi:hypothetical protein